MCIGNLRDTQLIDGFRVQIFLHPKIVICLTNSSLGDAGQEKRALGRGLLGIITIFV